MQRIAFLLLSLSLALLYPYLGAAQSTSTSSPNNYLLEVPSNTPLPDIDALSAAGFELVLSISSTRCLVRSYESVTNIPAAWRLTTHTALNKYIDKHDNQSHLSSSACQEHFLQYDKQKGKEIIDSYCSERTLVMEHIHDELSIVKVCLNPTDVLDILNQHWVIYLEKIGRISYDGITQSNGYATSVSTSDLSFSGKGVRILIGDDGVIDTHLDFDNRIRYVTDRSLPNGIFHHADRVAGLINGNGHIRPDVKGVALDAEVLAVSNFDAIEDAEELLQEHAFTLSCMALSDGCGVSYGTLSSLADYQQIKYPSLQHVYSAGNSGLENCGYGAGPGWANLTGDAKQSKNGITVGNTTASGQIHPSSSRGPTSDGRLKPDICIQGEGSLSTMPPSTYAPFSGTSAAAPKVTGMLALLQEAYETHYQQQPPSALLKALLLNTADDKGNVGPDYTYGWGQANIHTALQCLKEGQYFNGLLNHKSAIIQKVSVPEDVHELRIMLYWHDAQSHPLNQQVLINDLDILVEDPDGNVWKPLVLDHRPNSIALNGLAKPGRDSMNNVEQIRIPLPEAGDYRVLIQAPRIMQGGQTFYVTYHYRQSENVEFVWPRGGEKITSGNTYEIKWNSYGLPDKELLVEHSIDGGENWELLGETRLDNQFLKWDIPTNSYSHSLVRIKFEDRVLAQSEPFIISPPVIGLQLVSRCSRQAEIAWQAIEGAISYRVLRYADGAFVPFHESTSSKTQITLTNSVEWISVAPVFTDSLIGQRAVALLLDEHYVRCDLTNDLSLQQIQSPREGVRTNCGWNDKDIPVQIAVENKGDMALSGITFYYQWDDHEVRIKNHSGILLPNSTLAPTFEDSISDLSEGNHSLRVWLSQEDDQNPYNDTLRIEIDIVNGELFSIPYLEQFDDFSPCNPSEDCDIKCPLTAGWKNNESANASFIHWRVHRGRTPTLETGPDTDQNTASHNGRYLYIEGSASCQSTVGHLYSPCFDLTDAELPVMNFWLHMYGSAVGSVYIDVFDGQKWIVVSHILGNAENSWKKVQVPLESFKGQIIQLRVRADTENGYAGDIAIDNFAVFDEASTPIADFFMSPCCYICPDQIVELKDNSFNQPVNWHWKIEPETYQFASGTNQQSQHPQIIFSDTGAYRITLTATNTFGSAMSSSQTVNISAGSSFPSQVTFDTDAPFPEDWKSATADAIDYWEPAFVIGSDNKTSQAWHSPYGPPVPNTYTLTTAPVDLGDANQAVLSFDLAALAFINNPLDSFFVFASTDCNATFSHKLFATALSDLPKQASLKEVATPELPYHWNQLYLDLAGLNQQSVSFQFYIKSRGNYVVFLDNISLSEHANIPQPVTFEMPATICTDEAVSIIPDAPGVDSDSIEWLVFLDDQLILQQTGLSPPNIQFANSGKLTLLTVHHNKHGHRYYDLSADVYAQPQASFSYFSNQQEIWFQNTSANYATLRWHFGDGDSSTDKNPYHRYTSSGSYQVSLTAKNPCGRDSSISPIEIIVSNTFNAKKDSPKASFFPNPTQQYLQLVIEEKQSCSHAQIQLYNVLGGLVLQQEIFFQKQAQLDVSSLSPGAYTLIFSHCDNTYTSKLVIVK